jgi:Glycosyltransferase family 87
MTHIGMTRIPIPPGLAGNGGQRPRFVGLGRVLLAAASLVVLALGAFWGVALVREAISPNSVSGHHDFFAFFSAATLIRDLRPDALYDRAAVMAVQRDFFPYPVGWAGYMAYINPPFAAVLQLPLAFLREESARLLWLAICVPIVAACGALLTADLHGRRRWLVGTMLVATFPTYQALVNGQWSPVLLLACLGALALVRRNRPLAAGLCLGVLAIKPPVLLLVLAWLLLARRWRVIGGALLAASAFVVVALPLTGVMPYFEYGRYLIDVALSHTNGAGATGASTWSGSLQNMEGLNGLAATIFGQAHTAATNQLTIVLGILVVAAVVITRPAQRVSTTGAVVAVCAGLLLNPNLFGQDCVLGLLLYPIVAPRLRSADAQLALAVGLAAVLDVAYLDTAATQQGLLYAPHVLTLVLLSLAVIGAVSRRWSVAPGAGRTAAAEGSASSLPAS